MENIGLYVVILIIALTISAVFVSFRRNKREIESFPDEDLAELSICVRIHKLPWYQKRLKKFGWDFVSADALEKDKLSSLARFRKRTTEQSLPLKEVLHSLNRSFALPASPMNLKCQNQEVDE